MTLLPFAREETEAPPRQCPRQLLGDILCARGMLTPEQLRHALQEQKNSREMLGKILLRMRFAGEHHVLEALAAQTGYDTIELADQLTDHAAQSLWNETQARQLKAVALALEENTAIIVLSDPFDVKVRDHIRRLVPPSIALRFRLATESGLHAFIRRAYGESGALQHWLSELGQTPVAGIGASANSGIMIETVEALLEQAVHAGASDIHMEPEAQCVRVRIRVDGMLQLLTLLHRDHWSMLAQRVKVQAGMDIVDTRNIQDGRFNKSVNGQEIDFRVSILPTQHGENIVIRILDQRRALMTIERLGFTPDQQAALRLLTMKPEGMLVITGPTGSGKTTTLYALLQTLDRATRNIMTLEDPIEYQVDHIRQTQVRENYNLGFAEGVRAILRQDPDTVLIGEIRDPDTAQMGLRAAMTGSQVFSTLHTQDCFGVFPRLREFGISPGLMAGNIMASVAQRLVRTLCPACRTMGKATEEECTYMGIPFAHAPMVGVPRGCAVCGDTAYKGRVVVCEILPLDNELNDLVANSAPRTVLQKCARTKGFQSLADDGLAKAKAGLISLQSLMAKVDIANIGET